MSYYYKEVSAATSGVGRMLYEVGYFRPATTEPARWVKESSYERRRDAAARVHYLNGGNIVPDSGLPEVG